MRAGHRLEDVRGYTLGQIKAYQKALDRLEQADNRRWMVAARSAQVSAKDFKKLMRETG